MIYTNAILKGNEELEWAKAHYPCFERAELLGAMSRIFSNCIGISGTHGKTTTSSMTTQVLLEAGLDPSAVIGGKLPAINAYGRYGHSQNFVCESCEYGASKDAVAQALRKVKSLEKLTKQELKASQITAFGKETALNLVLATAEENKAKAEEINPKVISVHRADETAEQLPMAVGQSNIVTIDKAKMIRNLEQRQKEE